MQFSVEVASPSHVEDIHSIELATALQYSEQVLPESCGHRIYHFLLFMRQ